MTKKELGRLSETLACLYLARSGYEVVTRNYRCKVGEIDIVTLHKNCLVFVEVRSKSSMYLGRAEDTFTHKKLMRIKLLGSIFLAKNHYSGAINYRFDAICISMHLDKSRATLSHYKSIFQF